MAFFLLCAYLAIVLIRPQELIASTAHLPVIMYTLVLTSIPFLFAKRNSGSPQISLLLILVVIISMSAIANGWSGAIFKYAPEFIASGVVPFVLFSKLITTPKKHKTIFIISVLSALLMVHNGISQKESEVAIGWAGSRLSEGTRITYLGTLGDPNDLGMFFVMIIPVIVYLITRATGLAKLFWLLAFAALLYGIFLTNSRGAFLGTLSLLGLWGVHRYGIQKMVFLGIALLPAVFIVASKFRAINAEEASAAGRINAWYEGFQMLIHHPFFGVGMNGFIDHNELTAHNSYVLVAAELGIFGFTIWMSFLLLTFIMLYQIAFYNQPLFKNKRHQSSDTDIALSIDMVNEIAIAKTCFFAMIGFAVTAFFLSRSYTYLLYIYSGISVASYYRAIPLFTDLTPITYNQLFFKLVAISFAMIIFLYIVVKILN